MGDTIKPHVPFFSSSDARRKSAFYSDLLSGDSSLYLTHKSNRISFNKLHMHTMIQHCR